MLSTFAKRGVVTLAVVIGVVAVGSWARAESWLYGPKRSGDYFENTGGGNWREVFGADGVNNFKEVGRTKYYIILEDASRDIRIRLYTNKAEIEFPGSGGYRLHAAGTYKP